MHIPFYLFVTVSPLHDWKQWENSIFESSDMDGSVHIVGMNARLQHLCAQLSQVKQIWNVNNGNKLEHTQCENMETQCMKSHLLIANWNSNLDSDVLHTTKHFFISRLKPVQCAFTHRE